MIRIRPLAAGPAAGLALALLVACAPESGEVPEERTGSSPLAEPLPALPDHGAVATSRHGMVVTGSPHATEAARRMLAAGGNAADAAVAAAFALAVAEPTQSGLGGRTQILVRRADGSLHGIDGFTEVPAGYDPATAPQGEHGHAAVAIPGTVAALSRLLEEHGTLPLATVVEPARRWAAEGLTLTEGEAGRLAGLLPELDPASPAARTFGDEEGRPLAAGTRLVQPELGRVLETLAREGAQAFYRGEIAARMAADMEANGGFVTLDDLAAYRAVEAPAGEGSYRGHALAGSWLPASGTTVIQILQILERLEVPLEEGPWAATVAEALLAGFEDRETADGWPTERALPWLTSDSLADRRAAEVAARLAERGIDVMPEEEAVAAAPRGPALTAGAFDLGREAPFTTHLSVADTFGNQVALTQSLGPTGGSRVVTPGLGFLYASTLGGYLSLGEPGHRPFSSQAPMLVYRDGDPWLVLGGAGGRRILSALVATLTRVVDQGMTLEEALSAPRLHPTGGQILVQEGWGGAASLLALGYDVEERERSYFARLNVVEITPEGTFRGVGDPRWTGSSAAGPN